MDTVTALETTVVDACAANGTGPDVQACVHIGSEYFVKYGDAKILESELATHQYIWAYAQSSPGSPRVARIVHCFTRGQKMYLVMEHIQLVADHPDFTGKMLEAVLWLATVPPASADHKLGPLGGGRIRHRFFKGCKAPVDFPDVKALNAYVNLVYDRILRPRKTTYPEVDISGDRLMFAQSDMHPSNFGVDTSGRPVLMDFAEVGLLPASFIAHTLFSAGLSTVAAALGLANNPNVDTLAAIARNLAVRGDVKFGLSGKK